MTNEKIFSMPFCKVYPLLIAKAERKGRTRAEVHSLTGWLTGYCTEQLEAFLESELTYGDFFRNAPSMNPARRCITGSVCGVRVEAVSDPLMRDIRYLDKLVDELAKGKSMEKILPREGIFVSISAQEAKQLIDTEEGCLIVDVRTRAEYDQGHIPGAVLIPDTEIRAQAVRTLPEKDQLILVYCRSGRRSRNAAQILAELGYTNIREFGGILNWPYEVE